MPDMFEVRKALPAGPQVRSYPAQFEVRTLAGTKVELRGYASTFEQPYDMYDMWGQYSEVISRGAFGKTLAESPKVQLLVNHGGLSLAQTTSGTLRLAEDEQGLHVEADLNPTRSDARDLIEALRDGAVDEMSFAFRVVRQQWSPDYDERRIDEVSLNRGDVSVVNLGANPSTSVAMRSQQARQLARVMAKLRDSRALDAPDLNMLTQALGWFSAIDMIVDEAQEQLAAYAGVPNPDADDVQENASKVLTLLRMQHELTA